MPYLVVNKNFSDYKVIRFEAALSIGRDELNDIVLNDDGDTAISRRHAAIDRSADAFILRDQSSNGTLIDNERVTDFRLSHGDTFQIVDYFFTFVDESVTENQRTRTGMTVEPDGPISGLSFDETATTIIKQPVGNKVDDATLKKHLAQTGIIAESQAMMTMYRDISEIAAIKVPVLILGEPGSGKEKIAAALHRFSNVTGRFVALNCSAIPAGIFESELFGSVKGAFHNAADKPGKLELADKGTLFLDEVGDMHLSLQPKLLRFLEDKTVVRLGDTVEKELDVRIVAATNQDIVKMMEEKSFRADFYQRLACIRLQVPPLRERRDDILPLSYFFLSKLRSEHNLPVRAISPEARRMLMDYQWPGNVRQLANFLLNAAVRCNGASIYPSHLAAASDDIVDGESDVSTGFPSMMEMERRHIIEALKQSSGNKLNAAKLLGISRDTLYKKIRKYRIGDG